MLFNIPENAYRIVAFQLEGIDKLKRAIAMYLVVTWRIALQLNAHATPHQSSNAPPYRA